jgi:hypothetical protein
MFRRLFRIVGISFALMVIVDCTVSLYAQTSLGQIAGNVTDQTGSVIPDATITVTNSDTQAVRSVKADGSGFYVATNLAIGTYSVSVAQSGFRGETRSGLIISADAHLTADFRLQVGSTNETITVSAVAGETLNTTSGELSHVIDTKQVQNLALNGRNYTQLMTLIPGAVVTNPDIFSVTTSLAASNQAINGNRADSGNLTVDGAFNLNPGSNGSVMNNVGADFIQEVKIETSNFSAEYGRTSGPAFNIVTKSGTDQFHGVIFEYLRNNLFDARPFFSAFKTQLVFNDFGYGVGGPILKDRLFFFVGEEWKRLRQEQTPTVLTTPSSALLSGNFAGLPQLFYPGTKTPIPGNNISGMMSADGKAIADVYSVENQLGQYTNLTGASNNLTVTPLNPLNFREDVVRLDFLINKTNSIYGRWISDHNTLTDPFGTFSNTGILPTTPTTRARPGQSYLLAETWTIRPTIINQAQANFSYASQDITPAGVNWERGTFGFQYNRLYPNGGNFPNGIPAITISGTPYAGIQGPNFALAADPATDIQLSDTISIVKGNHLIKVGGMVARDRIDQFGRPYYTGQINFNATSDPNTTGNALADALLGNFASYVEASTNPNGHFRFTQPEAFGQDTWKVTRKLSIEYGVRFQLILPMYTQGNNISNFDPSVYSAANAITVNTNGTVVPGTGNPYNGLVRAGNGIPADQVDRVLNINTAAYPLIPAGAPRGLYVMHGAFGPRFGFAYSVSDNTVVRGGFGSFYYRPEGNITFSQTNIQPFLSYSEFDNGNLGTLGTGAPNDTSLQAAITAIDPNLKTPYIEQFSLGIQQQLPHAMLLETNYVGNVGHHQLRAPNINFPNLTGVAANPSYSTNYFNPYKGFGTITQQRSDSNSNYNALQAYLSKRTGQVSFTVGYTFAKALGDSQSNGVTLENWQNLYYNYGETNIDRKHAFISTVVWSLPTFRKHNLFLREGIGGVQISAVVRVQSGPYYTITGNTSTGSRRANYLGGSMYAKDNRFTLSGHQAQWLNPLAFSAAPAGSFGSAGVGSVILPSLQQADVTLSKIFTFGERVQFKLQADSFNALNHTNYSTLDTTATDGTSFGRLNGAYPPRQFQFGAKLIF